MKRFISPLGALVLLSVAVYAAAENLLLPAYTPSPRGVYSELRVVGDVGVGDLSSAPAARLHITQTGTAPALRVDDQPADPTPLAIDDDGNLSVGTALPGSGVKLEMTGSFRLADGTQAVGRVLTSDAAGAANWQPVPPKFGGMFSTVASCGNTGPGGCNTPNPYTGFCTCPLGYSAHLYETLCGGWPGSSNGVYCLQ